jgi:hypothetical protein
MIDEMVSIGFYFIIHLVMYTSGTTMADYVTQLVNKDIVQ